MYATFIFMESANKTATGPNGGSNPTRHTPIPASLVLASLCSSEGAHSAKMEAFEADDAFLCGIRAQSFIEAKRG
jgi:hypothetical protein